ncbi:MAG: ribonuclease HI family protein [bacterium]|nr:ribonuclease HI family protein [bacterium]
MNLIIKTDGGSRGNPGRAACAYVAKDPSGNLREKRGKYLGRATNNVAEYEGVLLFLGSHPAKQGETLDFYLDSLLVVNQLKGLWKIKDENLKILNSKVKELTKNLNVSWNHVPREQNTEADALVNETLDNI